VSQSGSGKPDTELEWVEPYQMVWLVLAPKWQLERVDPICWILKPKWLNILHDMAIINTVSQLAFHSCSLPP